MTPRTFLQLGKLGDVINVLPLAHHEFILTGEKPVFVISRHYAPVLDRVDYVRPVIYDGSWGDLRGAIKWARERFNDLTVTQIFGEDFQSQSRTSSFQIDAWDRAGMKERWDALPLVIKRHAESWVEGRPIILLADHGQSSPFPHTETLVALLTQQFGSTHNISRLSTVRMENPCDCAMLYDHAAAVVTTETMHLHLSRATKTPVLALATDKPSSWHGSAWSPRFAFYCRYGEFLQRQDEFVMALNNALAMKQPVVKRRLNTAFAGGYNLATIEHNGATLGVYRYHPDNSWRTELAIAEGRNTSKIRVPSQIEAMSIEDARLFHYQDKLWMNYVLAKTVGKFARCVVGYGELVRDGEQWKLDRHIQPKIPGNDWSGLQKNFVPFTSGDGLFFITGSAPNQSTLELNGDRVRKVHLADGPKWKWGEIRGGAIVPHGEHLLRIFHSRTGDGNSARNFRYHIGALLMERTSPFRVVAVGKRPIIYADEGVSLDGNMRFKSNVVLPLGLITRQDKWLVSYGRNDCECWIAELSDGDLNL